MESLTPEEIQFVKTTVANRRRARQDARRFTLAWFITSCLLFSLAALTKTFWLGFLGGLFLFITIIFFVGSLFIKRP